MTEAILDNERYYTHLHKLFHAGRFAFLRDQNTLSNAVRALQAQVAELVAERISSGGSCSGKRKAEGPPSPSY